MDSLFTVILNFREGIYIRQVSASTPWVGLQQWARDLDTTGIPGMGEKSKIELIDYFNKFSDLASPTPVERVNSVWCSLAGLKSGFCLIYIVKTSAK